MTDNSDDMLLARLGEVGCQGRTHIESHLTEHNRGLAEIQQGWETHLCCISPTTVMGKGGKHNKSGKKTGVRKTQQRWEETHQMWGKHKKGEMGGIKMGCIAAVSTLTANPFGNLLEFQI